MRFLDFSDVRILYRHIRFYQFHKISLLCDHQELACTPKDPPRRVDMKETSVISFIRKLIELSTKPFENLLLWHHVKTAHVLLYLNKDGLLRLGEPLGGDWGNPAGPRIVAGFKILYENPLGKPS